jgi:hypothetical protein
MSEDAPLVIMRYDEDCTTEEVKSLCDIAEDAEDFKFMVLPRYVQTLDTEQVLGLFARLFYELDVEPEDLIEAAEVAQSKNVEKETDGGERADHPTIVSVENEAGPPSRDTSLERSDTYDHTPPTPQGFGGGVRE